MNPYSTHALWPPETLSAWIDMPKDALGHTAPAVEMYRDQWRKWAERTPKHLWYPPVLQAYAEIDRKKGGR